MADVISIEIHGIEKVQAGLAKFSDEIEGDMAAAGKEAGMEIIETTGLKSYPPAYHAPRPFVSDKQRRYFFAALRDGRIEVPYRRGQSPGSQDYGNQFYVEPRGYGVTAIGNRASYAEWLAGGKSAYMAAGGWRKLYDVAVEKIDTITRIYQACVDRLIARLKL